MTKDNVNEEDNFPPVSPFSSSDEPAADLAASVDDLPSALALPEDEEEIDINIEQALHQAAKGDNEQPLLQPLDPLKSFAEAKLDPLITTAITALGWTQPTGVQSLCLPYSLEGRDVAGFAQTGTGKTGVFLITVAQRILELKAKLGDKSPSPAAVILAPTRELAIQIEEEASSLYAQLPITTLAIYGGMNWEQQAQQVKNGIDVIVATPGRMKDYESKRFFSLKDVGIFVCDEVDRMFDMGFIEDVEYFFARLNPNAQKLIFSATTNERVKELAFEYLNRPEYISVHPEELTPDRIDQHALLCETPHKFRVILGLLNQHKPERAIIFTNTKLTAAWLHYKLIGNGINADLITGDLPQAKRIRLIKRIKSGDVKVLIATDVASRGLHISDVSHVYNFDLPDEAANYVHRIGRTARAGAKGASFSLICEEYAGNFLGIQELLGKDAPKTSWHAEEFLSVVDKAGNPFDDDFGRAPAKPERPSQPAPYERSGERSSSRASQPRRSSEPRRGERDRDRDHRRGAPAGGGQGHQGRRDRRPHQDRQHSPRSHARPATSSPQQATPKSFSGMFKRIATLVFGWFRKKS